MDSNKTNFQLWQDYSAMVPIPQAYADMSFYFMVGAALQRRVWCGNPACYPNTYIPLVGPPSCGKGLTINLIVEILRYHKLKPRLNPAVMASNEITPELMKQRAVQEAQLLGDTDIEELIIQHQKLNEEPLLFPIGANATTFEAMTQAMAKSTRRIAFSVVKEGGNVEKGIYTHCSLMYILPELSSFIKARTENIVNFLTDVYDCKDPYTYETKHQGKDIIRRPCLNFIAGTTQDYMQDIFNESILNDGFASRSWFISAQRPRFYSWDWSMERAKDPQIPVLYAHFINLVYRLSKVYGEVSFSPDANAILKKYWEVDMFNGTGRKNKSPKLNYYYGRKNIHLMKLCMILHFSECHIAENGDCDKVITAHEALEALRILESIETNMHEALQFGTKNPLTKVACKILRHLVQQGDKGDWETNLKVDFWADLPPPASESFAEVMVYLKQAGQVYDEDKKNGPIYKGPLWRATDLILKTSREKD